MRWRGRRVLLSGGATPTGALDRTPLRSGKRRARPGTLRDSCRRRRSRPRAPRARGSSGPRRFSRRQRGSARPGPSSVLASTGRSR
jgi:hypothetical protein